METQTVQISKDSFTQVNKFLEVKVPGNVSGKRA